MIFAMLMQAIKNFHLQKVGPLIAYVNHQNFSFPFWNFLKSNFAPPDQQNLHKFFFFGSSLFGNPSSKFNGIISVFFGNFIANDHLHKPSKYSKDRSSIIIYYLLSHHLPKKVIKNKCPITIISAINIPFLGNSFLGKSQDHPSPDQLIT